MPGSASCAASVRSPALPVARDACARALAVPLEHFSASRRDPRRVWYRPARAPLPPEPGRVVVCALLGRARRERGCVTPGDDRLETRAYAVKRYLFRLGHAARSARFACSIEQLVVGLAPVMGWGTVPASGAERARFVRAHRKSVQRWLDDLQVAGLVAHEPERDRAGRWWRTQIVLLAAPDPTAEELRIAAQRARGWRARERARRRRVGHGSRLAAIRRRARTPSRATQARLARAWTRRRHDARRRAEVEATIRRGAERAALLTHPFGAPPTSAGSPARLRSERYGRAVALLGSAASRPAPTSQVRQSLAAETGARTKSAIGPAFDAGQADPNCGSEEIGPDTVADFEAALEQRVIAREAALEQRARLLRSHVTARAGEVRGLARRSSLSVRADGRGMGGAPVRRGHGD